MLKIENNEIKLIVTDIDGTLIDDKQELPFLVRDKLITLQKEEIYVSIASGRMPLGFDLYTTALGIKEYSKYVIGANGSIVYNTASEEITYSNLMEIDDVLKATKILLQFECEFTISYENDDVLYCAGTEILKAKLLPGAYLDGMQIAKPFNIENIKRANKIVAKHYSPDIFEKVYRELKKY